MQWFFLTLIRIFDRRVKRGSRGPGSLDAFRQRAVNHICLIGLALATVNGMSALYFKRYNEVIGLEIPVAIISVLGYLTVRRVKRPEWVAAVYMTLVASCFTFYMIAFVKSAFSPIHIWYPLISFATILLCGRWLGMMAVATLFCESLLVLFVNRHHGFVLMAGLSFELSVPIILGTMISGFLASFAIMASVEISRQRADSANKKATALSLHRASLSLLGDMARDISRNMQGPLGTLEGKMEEVLSWDPSDTLHNRGSQMMQSFQQSVRELQRLTESLLLFSQTHGTQELMSLRAVDFLNHLNELTREKAIARGVSLDFNSDQPQALLHVPGAATLFALVSLVNKGVEAAAGQEPAWVRLQLRVYGRQMQIRVLDSGPSLSYRERRAIQEQTSQRSAWDVNLRLSLDFLDSIQGDGRLLPQIKDRGFKEEKEGIQQTAQKRRADHGPTAIKVDDSLLLLRFWQKLIHHPIPEVLLRLHSRSSCGETCEEGIGISAKNWRGPGGRRDEFSHPVFDHQKKTNLERV